MEVNFQTNYWWQYRKLRLQYAGGVKNENKMDVYDTYVCFGS